MKEQKGNVLLFDKKKYMWLIIGLVVTALGFILMIGGGSDDPEQFSDAIFGFRRLTLAPLLVLAGYGIQIYAIMKKTTNVPDLKGGVRSGDRQSTGAPSAGKQHKGGARKIQTTKKRNR